MPLAWLLQLLPQYWLVLCGVHSRDVEDVQVAMNTRLSLLRFGITRVVPYNTLTFCEAESAS